MVEKRVEDKTFVGLNFRSYLNVELNSRLLVMLTALLLFNADGILMIQLLVKMQMDLMP